MDSRKDSAIDAVLEQLIEHGPGDMAAVFAELTNQYQALTDRDELRQGIGNGIPII